MKKLYIVLFLFTTFLTSAQIVNIPDANFKAKLLQANTNNQTASSQEPVYNSVTGFWSVTSYNSIDTNNDGQIQVSEAQAIKWISVNLTSINNLTGIEAFTNLVYLNCKDNQLSSLNVSTLTNLKYLDCSLNQLTTLDVSNNTILNNLVCGNNLLTNLDVTNNSNLDFLLCYSNFLTALDLSNNTSLSNLQCSFNQLTALNLSNNVNLNHINCAANQLTVLDVSNNSGLYFLSCGINPLSSLNLSNNNNIGLLYASSCQLETLFLKNNNANWTVLDFSSNPNLYYICADENDINYVQSKINTYGYNATCVVNNYCSFTPGGTYYTVQGNNRYDIENNGCNNNDLTIPFLKFNIVNGATSRFLISNSTGNYLAHFPLGTYTFYPILENPNYFNVLPTNPTVTFPATSSPFTQDFCLTANGIHHDVEITLIPIGVARPGFDAHYKIVYKNKGTEIENGSIELSFDDALLDYVSANPSFSNQATNTMTWSYSDLQPFETRSIDLILNVNSPTEIPAVNFGDQLNYQTNITTLTTDEIPFDNESSLKQIVVGSFDPNDKTCLEGSSINTSYIGEYVHYMIRFENTGTYTAENIVVKDMIDTTKFDITTLQMISTDHSCHTSINGNKVEFIFENINLPFEDNSNDGYIVFKIKTKSSLTVDSTISNNASIYFDYNYPIITNTATSTFTVLNNIDLDFENEFVLHPIPAENTLSITTKNQLEISSISIYTILGQVVQIETNPNDSIDVSSLQPGNYFIKINTEKGTSSATFVKK